MALYSNLNLLLIKLFTMLVPRLLHAPFAALTGGLFYLVLGPQRRALRRNLRAVTGRYLVEGVVLSGFYKFSRNWCDQLLMMRLRGDELLGLIGRWTTERPLNDALAAGRGAILISIHLGNWELGGLGLAEKGYPMNVLTYPEPDEKVKARREVIRRERGVNFIYVDREASSSLAMVEAVNALNRNEVLAILGDRDGSSHSRELTFFGRPTAIPMGAAYLALATGAPVIPVFVPLEGERYAAIMEEPVFFQGARQERDAVIEQKMGEILQVFEGYIKRYPDQWYNFFDYWGGAKP